MTKTIYGLKAALWLMAISAAGCSVSPPEWVHTHSSPNFAGPRFLLGVGACTTSGLEPSTYREVSQQRAFAEIAEQIQSRVSTKWKEKTTTVLTKLKSETKSSFLTEKLLTSFKTLEGATVADTYIDQTKNVYYTLVVLNLGKFSEVLCSRIERGLSELMRKRKAARLARDHGKWAVVIRNSAKASSVRRKVREELKLLRIISPKKADRLHAGERLHTGELPSGYSIDLSVASGEDQRGIPGRPLPEPLLVQATVQTFAGEKDSTFPLKGVPLVISSECKGIEFLERRVFTDSGGEGRFFISHLPDTTRPVKLRIELDIQQSPTLPLSPALSVTLPVVNMRNCTLGLVLTMKETMPAARKWALSHIKESLSAIGVIRKYCIRVPPENGTAPFNHLKGVDLAIYADLTDKYLQFAPLKNSFSVQTTIRFRLAVQKESNWLWVGERHRAVGTGSSPDLATERAVSEALNRSVPKLKAQVEALLGG